MKDRDEYLTELINGDIARRKGDSAKAISHYDQALKYQPNSFYKFLALKCLAACYFQRDEIVRAAQSLAKCIALEPSFGQIPLRAELGIEESEAIMLNSLLSSEAPLSYIVSLRSKPLCFS